MDQDYQNRLVEWECRNTIKLARLGYLVANSKLDQESASDLIWECQPIAGWFPLETFSVESVIESAQALWLDAPELRALAQRAAERVADKWSGDGETAGAAIDWAIELMADYAGQEGINLVRQDEQDDADICEHDWQPTPGSNGLIDRCTKCQEERA